MNNFDGIITSVGTTANWQGIFAELEKAGAPITEGTISLVAEFSATNNNIKRQGNFIVGRLTGTPTAAGITIIGNIPEPFRPKSTIDIGIIGYGLTIILTAAAIRGSVMTNGDIVMAGATTTLALDAQFGYEITEK